ncbi:MAG: glycoside hydrolase family 15 protein [Candidatus Dormibacteria bacterium]
MAWARYPPIDDYGVIGDMQSAALVHRDGAVDWLCLPRFDSDWVFGRLIDWDHGGHLLVAPEGCTASRRYRTDSNVLETTWMNGRNEALVYDFMPVTLDTSRRRSRILPRLVRMVQPVRGSLEWRIELVIGDGGTAADAKLLIERAGWLTCSQGGHRFVAQLPEGFTVDAAASGVQCRGTLAVGATAVLALYDAGSKPPDRTSWLDATALRDATDSYWRTWLAQCNYEGRYAPLVRRSALVLKLLQYAPSGAFVAAPTTSLPEAEGGSLNWDYRFTWLRDMSVLVDTLHQLGFVREVDDFMDWLDRSCQCIPSDFQMLYRVDGQSDVAEHELAGLDGYRSSRPVRVGNAAADQNQLDVYGEVMEAAFAAWKQDKTLPRARRGILLPVVDHVLAHSEDADAGIWESRSRPKRYLYSQVMCWLALDRALRMDSSLRLGAARRNAALRARRRIKRDVLERGFNTRLGAFTQALDDDVLDASGLTVPLTGMVKATDARVVSTVAAVQRHLMREGLVYRHVGTESEFGEDEGAFLVCSFWLVDALAQMGRLKEAEELFARVTSCANDLGLLAEEFDPERDELAGNFPLALSHLSLLGAVMNLERASRGAQGHA